MRLALIDKKEVYYSFWIWYHIHISFLTSQRVVHRVSVVFRGSRTPANWAANKQYNGLCIHNFAKDLTQLANDASLPEQICGHEGFYKYLHKNSGTDVGIF